MISCTSDTVVSHSKWLARMDPFKPLLVILEGGDKVGKSAVYQLFRRATKYGPLVIDRFTGSNIVYDLFYGRERDIEAYSRIEAKMTDIFNVVVFVLVTDLEEQQKRIEKLETDKMKPVALENFRDIDELFREYAHNTGYAFSYIVDTTNVTAEETVQLMIHELKELGYVTEG